MATFYYHAVDLNGRTQTGSLDATDRPSAIRALRNRSLTPTKISPTNNRRFQRWLPQRSAQYAIDIGALALFLQQLASLLGAGLRLDAAIAALSSGSTRGTLDLELKRLEQSISDGNSLSAALAAGTAGYPDFVVKLIAAGERASSLPTAVERAAGLLSRTLALKQKLISALIYPTLLVIAGITTALVVVAFVLPKFVPIFAQSGVELPLSTRILMWISEAITVSAFPGLIGLILIAVLVRHWRRSKRGRLLIDRTLLKLPQIGKLIQLSEVGRVSVALEEMVSGGVPLADALTVAQDLPANHAVRIPLQLAAMRVRGGSSLSHSISGDPLFPPFMIQVLRVGEEIGNLAQGFGEVGRFMDAELQRRLDRLLTILTPLITLLMGGMVAMIIVSVLSAVLKLNELAF